ncbi:flagellar export protein FliJ [Salimicrobium halophilum]|uniref:Flagellar FliJ protein n=1 Tax=Salimicrobium halophilum TaxID=86666 RepID=A0A1G8QAM4_9BACI|nr:flagellar export protein FliJ [Salimicrobium halophilum]SDJ01859.1 flagellar FliJ protein [Salimicrobium halophilum]
MNIHAFHKLRDYQEREKEERQKKYQSAIDVFEEKATTLYNLLKEKENMEAAVDQELGSGMVDLHSIHYYQARIKNMEEEVSRLQPEVHKARQNMNRLEDQRDKAYVEVKKYEKIIDRKQQEFQNWVKYEESKEMDGISIQQFSNKVNR